MTNPYRILPFAGHPSVDAAALADLWTREAGLTPALAQERLPEAQLVATDPEGRLAAVCTGYLARHEQVRLDLWHVRVFVARSARRSEIGRSMLNAALAHLRNTGEGAGMLIELENPDVRRTRVEAVWETTRLVFIGAKEDGAHVRVHYFPGARVPLPAGTGADTVAPLTGLPPDWTTERVRGRLDDAWSQRLLSFWREHGALDEAEAQRRLSEVVCVLLGPDGDVAGVSSAFAAPVALIGGRTFWVYRHFVRTPTPQARAALISATFTALDEDFDSAAGHPIGLCLLIPPPEAALRPDARWDDPPMFYAGYLDDGRQVRIGYFQGASVV